MQNKELKPLVRKYNPSNVTLADNLANIGVSIPCYFRMLQFLAFNVAVPKFVDLSNFFLAQLRFSENSGMLISDGKQYKLKGMHWHTPSEHTINGVQYALPSFSQINSSDQFRIY